MFIGKGNKLLKNVKTRWVSMLSFMKFVMEQYWLLMAKMHVNVSRNNIVAINLSLFCDLELIIGLHVILPFLDFMHTLVKLTQSCDVFVCEFVDMVKVCQLDLYYFYFNPYTKFDDLTFEEPKTLESFNSKNLPMN